MTRTTTREATTRHWQLANNCIHHHQQEQQISVEFLSVGMRIGYKGGQRRVVALGGRWGATATATVANVRVIHQFRYERKATASAHQRRRRQCRKIWFSAFYALELKWGLQYQNVCLWFIATQRQQPLHNLRHSRRAAEPQPQPQSQRQSDCECDYEWDSRPWVCVWMWIWGVYSYLPSAVAPKDPKSPTQSQFSGTCRNILCIHRTVLFIACPEEREKY